MQISTTFALRSVRTRYSLFALPNWTHPHAGGGTVGYWPVFAIQIPQEQTIRVSVVLAHFRDRTMTTGFPILLFSTNAATKRRGEKAQCGWKERNRRESEKWGRGREFHGETGEDRLFVHGNGESERRRTRCGKCSLHLGFQGVYDSLRAQLWRHGDRAVDEGGSQDHRQWEWLFRVML